MQAGASKAAEATAPLREKAVVKAGPKTGEDPSCLPGEEEKAETVSMEPGELHTAGPDYGSMLA
jgi:hypothetical protein